MKCNTCDWRSSGFPGGCEVFMNKNNPILNDEGECQGYTQDAKRIKEAVEDKNREENKEVLKNQEEEKITVADILGKNDLGKNDAE